MRNIKSYMRAKHFNQIPDEIRSMKRLWPNSRGLRDRRDAEAKLFELGLTSNSVAPRGTPSASGNSPNAAPNGASGSSPSTPGSAPSAAANGTPNAPGSGPSVAPSTAPTGASGSAPNTPGSAPSTAANGTPNAPGSGPSVAPSTAPSSASSAPVGGPMSHQCCTQCRRHQWTECGCSCSRKAPSRMEIP